MVFELTLSDSNSLTIYMFLKVLVFILLASLEGLAQQPYFFKNYRTIDGLPNNEAYQSIQDKEGYMWFATDRGVSRYDGNRFVNFTENEGLTDNAVFGFFLENSGRLWFYTHHGGLCYFENDTIKEPKFNSALKATLETISSSIIVSMSIDEMGTVWLGMQNKLVIKIDSKGEIELFSSAPHLGKVLAIKSQNNGRFNLVYNGMCHALNIFKIEITNSIDLEKTTFDLRGNDLKKTQIDRLKMCYVDEHTIVIAFGNTLIKLKDGIISQKIDLDEKAIILYALHIDQNGHLWVGTRAGVYCFPQADLQQKADHFLGTSQISSIFQDNEGGFWFTSLESGVHYLPHFHIKSGSNLQIERSKAVDVVSSAFGVYVGYSNGDLDIFKEGDISKRITHGDLYYKGIGLIEIFDTIIVGKRRGNSLILKDTLAMAISSKWKTFFRTIKNDDQSDFIWKQGRLFFRYHSDSNNVFVDSLDLGMDKLRVRSATASSDYSYVWLGSSQGLSVMHNNELEHLSNKQPGLKGNIVDLDLLNDSCLLVTAQRGGLYKYFFKENHSELLHYKSGVNYNQSFVDSLGTIWVATFSGIIRIDDASTNKPKFSSISESNGLISNEVYRLTQFKNQIWAATGKCASQWDMNWIPDVDCKTAKISQITVNGENVDVLDKKTLSYRENHLQFFFNTISFQKPVEYHYRLKGVHSNWLLTSDREAIYSSLKPGDYVFELKHSDEEEIQSSIPFSIGPPLWLNGWFHLAIIILVLLITLGVLRIRFRVIKREDKLFELFTRSEQKALRAQVNPHFLFNAFNSIIELMVTKQYDLVELYMKKLTRLMRLVLQLSREEEILLKDELEFLQLYLALEEVRFNFSFQYELELAEDINADKLKIPSLLLQPYIENAIKHGVRSRTDDKGLLRLDFSIQNHQLIVKIIDNGKGYQASRAKMKKGSYGMKINGERIRLFNKKDKYDVNILPFELENNSYPGTVVTISLPLKNVNHENSNPQNFNR